MSGMDHSGQLPQLTLEPFLCTLSSFGLHTILSHEYPVQDKIRIERSRGGTNTSSSRQYNVVGVDEKYERLSLPDPSLDSLSGLQCLGLDSAVWR